MHIQSFCMSASATSQEETCVTAVVVDAEDHRRTRCTIEWHGLPLLKGLRDNPAETLYAILSSLVTDFDDHMVTTVVIEPAPQVVISDEG